MPIRLKRDAQQWMYNWMVKTNGRVFHFQADDRGSLPKSVKQHDMISKHLAKMGLRIRRLADEEEAVGHTETALRLYFQASNVFGQAQHPVLETTEEKRRLHGMSLECYDKVRELAPYRIEHIRIPWGDSAVYGNLHLLPGGEPAPCVIFVPGCDMTKEMYPYPVANDAHQRGMHLISIDGPGQGECNLADVALTADNYESAISAVVDYLETRSEVKSDEIVLFGMSFGSHWAIRAAAREARLKACAAPWASICDKRYLMEVESPRYKQLFAYLTKAETEDELDEIIASMDVTELIADVECPTLLTVGEYDPRSPLQEVVALYERMTCPRQLWVHEDQHHGCSVSGHFVVSERDIWDMDVFWTCLDWLRDRLRGVELDGSGGIRFLRAGGGGPYGKDVGDSEDWMAAYGLGDRPGPTSGSES